MASDLSRTSSQQQAEVELEFLQTLLDDDAYPWSNGDASVFESLADMEAALAEQLSEPERDAIATQGQQFFQTLQQQWTVIDNASTSNTNLSSVQSTLMQTFRDRVPTDILETLAQKAMDVVQQPSTLAEQLVLCVQDCVPSLLPEDLQVLARPYAYAMRDPGTDKLDAANQAIRPVPWNELSPVEQARLSMAIAHYSLSQATNDTTET